MGLISIEGIKVFAHHGDLPEEAVLGGHFVVNVWVTTNMREVKKSDKLEDTVDYVKITEVIKKEMQIRSEMIEHVAGRIVTEILLLNKVEEVKVEIEKKSPPIDVNFDKISVLVGGKN
tara:strand:+ start:1461 stop:1814 length:354 start_codon:yes stop_codon:yes gene_type:complete